MKKINSLTLENEQEAITKYLIKGLTIKEMSEKLMCSTSSVSYKLNKLFKKHRVETRREFIYGIIGQILDNKTKEINAKNNTIKEFRSIIHNLSQNKDNSETFSVWENKAKILLDKTL